MEKNELLSLTFEEALKRLEDVVDTLESGEVPLEKAIDLFQDGMLLSQVCSQKLDNVEQKIETLLEGSDGLVVKTFELEEDREVKLFHLQDYLTEKKRQFEQALPAFLPTIGIPPMLAESMEYSLYAGGKRIRPILVLATLESFGKDSQIGLPVACAVEMIHTYSLIHDDLPAMDNDDFRRGKPTNHKQYGEATAILAGDGLLTEAFRSVCGLQERGVEPTTVLNIICELSRYAGPQGMVGGQMADLLGEGKQLQLSELQYIHQHKTADLVIFCIRAGAYLSGASNEQMELLTTFGRNIGLAFQIQDDILDVYGEEAKLGKAVGSDAANGKSTYPSLLGLEESQRQLNQLLEEAKEALYKAEIETHLLEALADFIVQRDQ